LALISVRSNLSDGLSSNLSLFSPNSAPTFASIIALINDARKKKGLSRVGWINPTLYKHPEAFNDIVSGGALGCGDENTGFNAMTGFDLAGGLGAPKFDACELRIFLSSLRTS
jgi:tripeptidyl-peptidase-1